MTGSRRVPAGTLTTSTNATNGSGNLFVDFKDLVQPVAIYFVALLSSIVASTVLLVNAGCCIFTTVVLARELGLEPRIAESKSAVLPITPFPNNMAEDGGVEPHPISRNLVFKASRRTNAPASSSNMVPWMRFELTT